MKVEEQRKRLSDVWRTAADLLSIKIETPYLIESADGVRVPCVAFLSDFGGPCGMVIGFISGPSYKTDRALKAAAEKRGCFYSFINFEVYETYDEDVFKEALTDWGYFGDEALRPDWMRGAT